MSGDGTVEVWIASKFMNSGDLGALVCVLYMLVDPFLGVFSMFYICFSLIDRKTRGSSEKVDFDHQTACEAPIP